MCLETSMNLRNEHEFVDFVVVSRGLIKDLPHAKKSKKIHAAQNIFLASSTVPVWEIRIRPPVAVNLNPPYTLL
jgi:hypothetical protein